MLMTKALMTKTWKRYGLLAAVHVLSYRMAQRLAVVDVTNLMLLDLATIKTPVDSERVVYRPLSHDEVIAYAVRDPALDLEPSMAQRIQGNLDVCFGAIVGDRLVGYSWLALNSIEAIHNSAGTEQSGVAISFPPNTIFSYKAFVLPTFRGRGLYGKLVEAAGYWAYAHRGVKHHLSTTDWTNFAAKRGCERQGRRRIGRIWRVAVAGRSLTFAPRAAAAYGIQIGHRADVTRRTQGRYAVPALRQTYEVYSAK